MKARTLVFTLLIGLMCFAGFGNTTADLSQNSETEQIQAIHSESVVSPEVIQANLEVTSTDVVFKSTSLESDNQVKELFGQADSLTLSSTNLEYEKLAVPPDLNLTNKNFNSPLTFTTPTKLLNSARRPRDGLNSVSFLFI